MFLKIIVNCLYGILGVLRYLFDSSQPVQQDIDPKVVRDYAVDLACQEKMTRLITGRMQQPYAYVLSVLCNMLVMANYIRIKFPHMIENKHGKFDESCRDIKILLRSFDALVAKHIQTKIEQGMDMDDLDAIREELDYAFRNMLHQGWLEWLQHSQKKIGAHINLLKYLSVKEGGHGAEVIGYLVKQALTSGPVSEIMDMDMGEGEELE